MKDDLERRVRELVGAGRIAPLRGSAELIIEENCDCFAMRLCRGDNNTVVVMSDLELEKLSPKEIDELLRDRVRNSVNVLTRHTNKS